MITDTLHALEGGIKYPEIIVFGFINTSKGKEEKNIIEKICLLDSLPSTKRKKKKNTNRDKTKNCFMTSKPKITGSVEF